MGKKVDERERERVSEWERKIKWERERECEKERESWIDRYNILSYQNHENETH